MIKKKTKLKYEKRLCLIAHQAIKKGKEVTEENKQLIDNYLDAANSLVKYNIVNDNCDGEVKRLILDTLTLLAMNIVSADSLDEFRSTLFQCGFHVSDYVNEMRGKNI